VVGVEVENADEKKLIRLVIGSDLTPLFPSHGMEI
jgi:hypothetical protein